MLRRDMVKASRKGLLRSCSTFRVQTCIFVMLWLLKIRRYGFAAKNAAESRDGLSNLTVKFISVHNDTVDGALTDRPRAIQLFIFW